MYVGPEAETLYRYTLLNVRSSQGQHLICIGIPDNQPLPPERDICKQLEIFLHFLGGPHASRSSPSSEVFPSLFTHLGCPFFVGWV